MIFVPVAINHQPTTNLSMTPNYQLLPVIFPSHKGNMTSTSIVDDRHGHDTLCQYCNPRFDDEESTKCVTTAGQISAVANGFVNTNLQDPLLPLGETTAAKNITSTSLPCNAQHLDNGDSIENWYNEDRMTEDGRLKICPSMLFDTFKDLSDHVQKFSQQNGFTSIKSTHLYKQETNREKAMILQRFSIGSLDPDRKFLLPRCLQMSRYIRNRL
jgi:hypothetical protein